MGYTIRETDDYKKLSQLYHDSDLEIALGEDPPGKVIKHWECVDDEARLLAGATLLYKLGHYVFEDLAVVEDMKGKGLGKELLNIVTEEAKSSGAKTLWLCAKVPEYYKKFDWEPVDKEEAPPISLCQDCEKFHVSCFPIIMKKELI